MGNPWTAEDFFNHFQKQDYPKGYLLTWPSTNTGLCGPDSDDETVTAAQAEHERKVAAIVARRLREEAEVAEQEAEQRRWEEEMLPRLLAPAASAEGASRPQGRTSS